MQQCCPKPQMFDLFYQFIYLLSGSGFVWQQGLNPPTRGLGASLPPTRSPCMWTENLSLISLDIWKNEDVIGDLVEILSIMPK